MLVVGVLESHGNLLGTGQRSEHLFDELQRVFDAEHYLVQGEDIDLNLSQVKNVLYK